jgi:hypothetical protein
MVWVERDSFEFLKLFPIFGLFLLVEGFGELLGAKKLNPIKVLSSPLARVWKHLN